MEKMTGMKRMGQDGEMRCIGREEVIEDMEIGKERKGFWLKACRTAGHDICQSVGLASGSGIKGMSHIISMTHMQQ